MDNTQVTANSVFKEIGRYRAWKKHSVQKACSKNKFLTEKKEKWQTIKLNSVRIIINCKSACCYLVCSIVSGLQSIFYEYLIKYY